MTGLSNGWYNFANLFNERARKMHAAYVEKGFYGNELINFGEKIALIHSELSEALEAHRCGAKLDPHLPTRLNLEVELADAVIRIMDLAAYLELDLGTAIAEKHAFNSTRPHKHGKDY